MDPIRASGAERIAAIALAPQFSELSVGQYIQRTLEAAGKAGVTAEFRWAQSYHDEPLLIDAFAERLRPLLPARKVLFTAHSLPEKALAGGDPYDRETRATAAAVAARVGLAEWDFAYQSQGMTADTWLGPSVESCLDRYAAEGIAEVVLDPIGFVCDHVEVLFDVDILFGEYAQKLGISLRRPESLNDSARFTEALAKIARQCLE